MRSWGWTLPVAVGLTALLTAASSAQPSATRVRHREMPAEPVVVELFTAQGCAGCPEANARVEAVAAEPGVIALTYAVDYWDYLGWADTFARPEFAQRQRAYRHALRLRNVSTPQVVINKNDFVGKSYDEAKGILEGAGWKDDQIKQATRRSKESAGTVVDVDPTGRVDVGTPITLTVSDGTATAASKVTEGGDGSGD